MLNKLKDAIKYNDTRWCNIGPNVKNEVDILYQDEDILRFRTVLWNADNEADYNFKIMINAIKSKSVQERLKTGTFFGEYSTKGFANTEYFERFTTVDLHNVSHRVLELDISESRVYAIIEVNPKCPLGMCVRKYIETRVHIPFYIRHLVEVSGNKLRAIHVISIDAMPDKREQEVN